MNSGSTSDSTSTPQDFFHPVSLSDSSEPSDQIQEIGNGSAGAGRRQELATTTFTVNSIVNGPPTQLLFSQRPQISGEVSAIWYEDGTVKDTLDGDALGISTGVSINVPDTIVPTASATLSPILGSTSSYQFTVNYSDNQALNQLDFGSNNIQDLPGRMGIASWHR